MRRLNYRYYSWPGTDWMSAFFFTRQELGKPANLAGVYDITAAAIYKGPVGSPTPLCWYLAEGLCHETSQWHFGSALGSCTAVWSQQHCIAHENGKRRKGWVFFISLWAGFFMWCSLYGIYPQLQPKTQSPVVTAGWRLFSSMLYFHICCFKFPGAHHDNE